MQTEGERRAVSLLRRYAEPLPDPDGADPGAAGAFARAFDRFADARVVPPGKATHVTSDRTGSEE